MGKASDKLKSDLIAACSSAPTWADSGKQIGEAIDAYLKAVQISTSVSGAGVGPPPGSVPFTGVGTGTGTLAVTGTTVLVSACTAAYTNPTWAGIGTKIASAVTAYVPTGTVTTNVTGGLTGAGAGPLVLVPPPIVLVPPPPTFSAQVDALFANSALTWKAIGEQFSTMIVSLFSSITLTTTDAGVIPAASWTGTGTGSLTWA